MRALLWSPSLAAWHRGYMARPIRGISKLSHLWYPQSASLSQKQTTGCRLLLTPKWPEPSLCPSPLPAYTLQYDGTLPLHVVAPRQGERAPPLTFCFQVRQRILLGKDSGGTGGQWGDLATLWLLVYWEMARRHKDMRLLLIQLHSPQRTAFAFFDPDRQRKPSLVSGCVIESTLTCYKLTLNVISSTRRASCEFKQTNKAN